jgi:hypothetical protein
VLAKRQTLLTGPGIDQVQRSLCPAVVEGAAQRPAIDCHDLPVEGLGKGLRPGAEADLKGVRIDTVDDQRRKMERSKSLSAAHLPAFSAPALPNRSS